MKKLKGLLLVLFASVMAFSFSACSSCSSSSSGGEEEDPGTTVTDTRKPASVSVDTTDVKTLYYVGSDIDLTGLVINVTYDDGSTATVEDGATGLVIDTSMYKSSTVGTYTIYVYYTLNSTRKYTTFTVEVTDEQNSVQFDITAATTEYTLVKDILESVDLSSITPTVVLDGETLGTSAYTIKYYSADTELTSATDLTVTAGVYQIWAYVDDYYDDLTGKNYDLSTFVLIYVLDPVVSIVENGDGTYTQEQSNKDSISSTWSYTATYSSGNTAQIAGDDEGISVTIDTNADVGTYTATVSYTEADAKGTSYTVSVTNGVSYTLTEAAESTSTLVSVDFTDTDKFATGDIASTTTDPVELTYKDGSSTGFYLTKSSASDTTKYNKITTSNNRQCLQMQGSAKTTQNSLRYELSAGTYIVEVSYFQTSAGRYAVVLDKDGNTISGTVADAEKTDTEGTVITRTMTITVSEDGYIYIGSASSGLYITAVSIYVTNAAS